MKILFASLLYTSFLSSILKIFWNYCKKYILIIRIQKLFWNKKKTFVQNKQLFQQLVRHHPQRLEPGSMKFSVPKQVRLAIPTMRYRLQQWMLPISHFPVFSLISIISTFYMTPVFVLCSLYQKEEQKTTKQTNLNIKHWWKKAFGFYTFRKIP